MRVNGIEWHPSRWLRLTYPLRKRWRTWRALRAGD